MALDVQSKMRLKQLLTEEQMKEFLLRRINSKNETTKIEFKKTIDIHSRKGQAELIKDALAIANSTSDGEETGYLIIGAYNGQIYDIAGLGLDDATMQQIINKRCHKPIEFQYSQCVLDEVNTTGVIIIPRSSEQPHLVREDFFDERGNLLLYEGECPIREGTSTRRASREDFDRMYQERMEKERQKTIQQVFELVKKKPGEIPSLSDIITMDLQSLEFTVLDMLRRDDLVGLKALVNEMRLSLIQKWKETEDKETFDEEKVKSLKNLVLRPTLDDLTLIGKMDIQLGNGEISEEILKALSSIYELSNIRNLGIDGTPEHLSWTVPSKSALQNLYTLGAYLTFERKTDIIKALLSVRVQDRRKRLALMVSHPNFNYDSGEGDLTVFFDEAIGHVKDMLVFFKWFESDEEKVMNAFCQFDFLVACYHYMNKKPLRFPNFARYFRERQTPLWKQIEEEPERFRTLLGDDPMATVNQVVEKVDEFAHRNFDLFHSWV